MMNIYERKDTRNTKQERLNALDEATERLLPTDILKYVIAEYMDVEEEVVVERLKTFKMQPRQPVKELDRTCLHYCGCQCTEITADLGYCVCLFGCILPAMGLFFMCTSAFDCIAGSHTLDRFCEFSNRGCPQMPCDCAKTDYRLKRSKCTDCAALCHDMTCGRDTPHARPVHEFGREPPVFIPRPQLNGPEAMWMS